MSWHVGRSWTGTPLEDVCPCDQEPCGLVDMAKAHPDCEQHNHTTGKPARTMRQGHPADECPGRSS